MVFMKKLGFGLLMLVGGSVIATFSIYYNPRFSAGKFLNALSIIGMVGGFLTAAAGVLYIRAHSPFNKKGI